MGTPALVDAVFLDDSNLNGSNLDGSDESSTSVAKAEDGLTQVLSVSSSQKLNNVKNGVDDLNNGGADNNAGRAAGTRAQADGEAKPKQNQSGIDCDLNRFGQEKLENGFGTENGVGTERGIHEV
jgi:hypothetical protein